MVAHRRLASRLGRRPLQWAELTELDWVLGAHSTPMREQITDFFLRAGINAVQNGLAQRAAFFIHRDAIAPQGGQANALNFSRIQAGLF